MAERPLLPAVVGPWAAYVIARDYGPELERKGRALNATGQDRIGGQLLQAVALMRESGRQQMAAHRACTSDVGRSEVPIAAGERESEFLLGSGASTRQAADQLDVSERQVLNLIRGEKLVGRLVSGRWVIDGVSLAHLVENRRSGR